MDSQELGLYERETGYIKSQYNKRIIIYCKEWYELIALFFVFIYLLIKCLKVYWVVSLLCIIVGFIVFKLKASKKKLPPQGVVLITGGI